MTTDRTLPALVVKVEGAVLETNIDAYRDAALAYVETINTLLKSDDDFAEAEGIVKWCGDAEKKIKAVKTQAMEQAADINAVFTALDDISGALRDKRLALNKQVKAQKEERKREVVEAALAGLVTHVGALEAELEGFKLAPPQDYEADLETAAKGKKTLKTLNKALDKVLDAAKSEYATTQARVLKNLTILRAHEDHAFLFSDAQDHLSEPEADFADLVKTRIAEHEEQEKARLERERESLREEVREEERAKIEEEVEAARDERAGSRNNPHTHHTIDFIELGALDVAVAKKFYGAAFGWRFTDYGSDYAGIQGDGREPGGLCKVASVGQGGPLILLYSSDLDKTLAAVKKAGGKLKKEPFDFDGGRQFHFFDPSGNELAVWSDQ